MLTHLFASLIITLSVLIGTHIDNNLTLDYQTPYQKNQGVFSNFESNFKANLIENIPWLIKPKPPKQPKIPPQKLPHSEFVPLPDLNVKASISVNSVGKIFYQKNINQPFPIASLTKLLTALIVMDNLDPDSLVKISENAISTYGEMGNLVVGEEISVKNLLYVMLVNSSNDAAVALAEATLRCQPEYSGVKNKQTPANNEKEKTCNLQQFVELMNKKANQLGMTKSHFTDPVGLNPDNISTAYDLVRLTNAVMESPLLKQIINTKEVDVFSNDNQILHRLSNTNKLLGKINGVIGGKTGYTEEAGECMILIVDSPENNGYVISVVLGAEVGMRFNEVEKLLKWTRKTFGW